MKSIQSPTSALIAFLLGGIITPSGESQTRALGPRPEFEVASVKISKSSTAGPGVRITPGRLNVENLTLHRLIFVAYRIRDFQISSGPGWINSERYDIDAKTEASNGADAMLRMLQALLEDRFHLRFHHETKEGAVYFVTIAKNGSKMHAASCVPFDPNNLPKQAAMSDHERGSQCGGISRSANALDGDGMSLEDATGPAFQSLAGQLSLVLDRPVINRTGLSGRFDVHLRWNADQGPSDPQNEPSSPSPSADQNGPSIFTAIQEQLGLKLEAGKGPVDNFVIDHVEKLSEN